MWEMMDPDLECGTECGGPGPPPEFLVPPPPRPPFLAELLNCNEEQQQQQQQQQQLPFGVATGGSSSSSSFADVDMCEAFPILDASYHSGPSFQTSAMIVLCSVLLLLVIFISSLLVWKHKRKVQNFLPCKTPTRGGPHHPHLDAAGVHSGAHSVTYEDPDVHLGHHPLVMRHHHHHHNMELHAKQIHYPSGYPMPRSPPLFICSSPGPDPYRSHDNVYEELEHGHLHHHHHHHHPHHLQQQQQQSVGGRDTDSEPPIQSDDDFAEDELSLPGDRSFHKSPSDATTVATIYHDRSNGGGSSNSAVTTASAATVPASDLGGGVLERNRTERNSLLSSSSSSNANDNPIPLPPRGGNGSNGGGGPSPPGGGGTGTGGSLGNNNNNNGSNSSSASNSNRNSNSSADCASGHSGNGNGSSGGSNNNNNNTGSGKSAGGGQPDQGALLAGGLGGLFRSHRKQHHHPSATLGSGRSRGRRGGGQHPLPAAAAPIPAPDTDPIGLPPLYDERGMMTLPPPAYHHPLHHPVSGGHHHQHHLMNSLNNNSASSANSGGRSNYYSTIDDDELLDPVERRNRINAQLSAGPAAVSTIFRHRGPAPSPPLPPHHHQHHHHNNNGPLRLGSRTNPRNGGAGGGGGMLRNGVIAEPNPAQYIYHEPVSFHEGLIYDGCLSYSDRSGGSGSTGGSTGIPAGGHPYILPQFSTFRSGSGSGGGGGAVMISGAPGSGAAAIYSRDSSFGSDSGYSQHTQASNRSGGGCWQGHRPHRPAPPSGGPSVKHGGGSGGATEPTLQPVVRPPSPVSGVGGS